MSGSSSRVFPVRSLAALRVGCPLSTIGDESDDAVKSKSGEGAELNPGSATIELVSNDELLCQAVRPPLPWTHSPLASFGKKHRL